MVKADGSPDELIRENNSASLEDAYVNLTQEKARIRYENNKSESGLTKLWHKLFRPKTPNQMEGFEDE